jgi:hypothetical protein
MSPQVWRLIASLCSWRFARGGGKPRLVPEAGVLAAADAGSRPSTGRIKVALRVSAVPVENGAMGICFYFVRMTPASGTNCLAVVACLKLCQWMLASLKNITSARSKNIESKLCPSVEIPPAGSA